VDGVTRTREVRVVTTALSAGDNYARSARLWDQKKFKGNDQPDQTMTKIREAMIPIIKEELSMAQAAQPLLGNIAVQGFVSSTLVAMPVDKKPRVAAAMAVQSRALSIRCPVPPLPRPMARNMAL